MAGASADHDVRQASRLFGVAYEKVGEVAQAAMEAAEHVRSFSAVL
ncbi:hypothetical protein [Actinopolyspora erythraea]|nr:hypothetical protein [Actinopolyspora erythraea]